MTAASAIAETYVARTPKSAQLNAEAKPSMPGGDTRSTAWFPPYPPFASRAPARTSRTSTATATSSC